MANASGPDHVQGLRSKVSVGDNHSKEFGVGLGVLDLMYVDDLK